MGCGLPYSVGAAIAYPDRQVVCIVGDGGFTMLMGELATMVKYQLPVKIILFKNDLLGMIKWEQLAMEGNPQFGVQLQPIDYEMYAQACGGHKAEARRDRAIGNLSQHYRTRWVRWAFLAREIKSGTHPDHDFVCGRAVRAASASNIRRRPRR
jgi:thiamine pyrophosphate-dependent acetolactate synthase large subunit-like protein